MAGVGVASQLICTTCMCVGFSLCSFALLTEFCFLTGEKKTGEKKYKRKKQTKKASVDPGTTFMIRMQKTIIIISTANGNRHQP